MTGRATRELSVCIAEPQDFDPMARKMLEALGTVVELDDDGERALHTAFQEHDVVWLRLQRMIGREALGSRPRCRALACAVTGLDHIDLDACRELGVEVLSLKGETEFLQEVRATAEHAIGLMLALLRHLPRAAASVEQGRWARDEFRGRELFRKTAGVVGVGRLGGIVAGYLQALGMDVLGFDPYQPSLPNGVERMDSLAALLEAADVVTLHVPLNDETRGLIGAVELGRMKSDAVLINTSRGAVVDEGALLTSLREHRLGGAALDVLVGEPAIDETHPLVAYAKEADNLLIVPHLGGNTYESFAKTEQFVARKVVAHMTKVGGRGAQNDSVDPS